MPADFARLEMDGTISAEHFAQIKYGFRPKTPKDKWFIYFADEWLHFHRAQTGSCIFSLEIKPHMGHYLAQIMLVNQHPKQYRSVSQEYDVQLLSYLMDRYLLGRNVSFPIPPKMNQKNVQQHQKHVIGETSDGSGPLIDLNSLLDGLN